MYCIVHTYTHIHTRTHTHTHARAHTHTHTHTHTLTLTHTHTNTHTYTYSYTHTHIYIYTWYIYIYIYIYKNINVHTHILTSTQQMVITCSYTPELSFWAAIPKRLFLVSGCRTVPKCIPTLCWLETWGFQPTHRPWPDKTTWDWLFIQQQKNVVSKKN